jgi:hypothetical protein
MNNTGQLLVRSPSDALAHALDNAGCFVTKDTREQALGVRAAQRVLHTPHWFSQLKPTPCEMIMTD